MRRQNHGGTSISKRDVTKQRIRLGAVAVIAASSGRRAVDGVTATQTGPVQLDAVGAMHDAVKNGVTDSWIAHQFVPTLDGKLAGHQQGAFLVSVVDNLQHVAPLLDSQRFEPPVIDDDESSTLQARQQTRPSAFATSCGAFDK